MSKAKRYPDQFKREALELVRLTDRPASQIAEELGISDQTLRNWIKNDRIERGEERTDLSGDERRELLELRRENKRLKMERDVLKKPRPSSRRRKIRSEEGVQVHSPGEGQLPGEGSGRGAWREPHRLLQLGEEATFGQGLGGSGVDRVDQVDSCRQPWCLRGPENPCGTANGPRHPDLGEKSRETYAAGRYFRVGPEEAWKNHGQGARGSRCR